jgi:hypothetical protein
MLLYTAAHCGRLHVFLLGFEPSVIVLLALAAFCECLFFTASSHTSSLSPSFVSVQLF